MAEDAERIRIVSSALEASIRKKGYITGVEAQSLLDKQTGFRDLGFGLDIVDARPRLRASVISPCARNANSPARSGPTHRGRLDRGVHHGSAETSATCPW